MSFPVYTNNLFFYFSNADVTGYLFLVIISIS